MSDEHSHEHHAVNYTAIFGLLCVCTLASICFDWFKDSMPKPLLIVLILGVALCKATFVLLYFMHIKFETAWKYVLLAPTAVLACALPFALAPDIAYHYYNVSAEQRLIAAEDTEASHAHPENATAVHGNLDTTLGDSGPKHGHGDEGKAPVDKDHGNKPHK